MNTSKIKLVMFGGACLFVSAFSLNAGATHGTWREAHATVISVKTECHMRATERGILTKTTSTATIPCGDVDAFKAHYSDKDWSTTKKYIASLRVQFDGNRVETTMELGLIEGRAPHRGDNLTVSQNPENPKEIRPTATAGSELAIGMGAGGLGAVSLLLAFWRRRPKGELPTMELPPIERGPAPATYSPAQVAAPRAGMARTTFGRRGQVS